MEGQRQKKPLCDFSEEELESHIKELERQYQINTIKIEAFDNEIALITETRNHLKQVQEKANTHLQIHKDDLIELKRAQALVNGRGNQSDEPETADEAQKKV